MTGEPDKRIPRHVAIIMDGNGRWAAARGQPRSFGHKQGMEALRKAVRYAAQRNIGYLTLYAFSSENWSRPKEEIKDLFGLLRRFVQKNLAELHQENVRVHIIGMDERLENDIRGLLDESEELTKNNTGLQLVIALNYGSRQEIIEAARKFAAEVASGQAKVQDLTLERFASYLTTSHIPDPDVIIRTSGEQRLSNFLLWQVAYSEFIFLPVLWPDFDDTWFDQALNDYASRERDMAALPGQAARMQKLKVLLASENLQIRVLSSLIMIPVALAALWLGGAFAILFMTALSCIVYYEWVRLAGVRLNSWSFWLSQGILLTAAALLILGAYELAATFWFALVVIIGFIHLLFRNADSWKALGLLYALTLLITLILLRQDNEYGFRAAFFVLVIVWVTDICAYLFGNLIGGKKLAPRISPKKTMSGFFGGIGSAAIAGVLFSFITHLPNVMAFALLSLLLSLASQIGDLFESWIKRQFNAKDSSQLIPGHGGVLDRVDSLAAASLVAYLIGIMRAGFGAPAQGLLLW